MTTTGEGDMEEEQDYPIRKTPRPNAIQAAYLVERIEAIYPEVSPRHIVDWCVSVCRAMRDEGRTSSSDVDALESRVSDARPAGVPTGYTIETWVQKMFSGGTRPNPTLEQAEGILQTIRESGFCPIE